MYNLSNVALLYIIFTCIMPPTPCFWEVCVTACRPHKFFIVYSIFITHHIRVNVNTYAFLQYLLLSFVLVCIISPSLSQLLPFQKK